MRFFLKHLRALFLIVSLGGGVLMAAPEKFPAGSTKGLSSDDFAEREASYLDIKNWAERNIKNSPEELYAFWLKQNKPEVRARANALMQGAFDFRLKGRESGFVGVGLSSPLWLDHREARRGVRISSVSPGLAGEKAGLKQGDIVTALDGKTLDVLIVEYSVEGEAKISEIDAFIYYIMLKSPEDVVTLELTKNKIKTFPKVKLVARPETSPPHPSQLKAVRQIIFNQWVSKLDK